MSDKPQKTEGLRERKRRETRARLTETGLRLFVEKGYDKTTLDAIAEAAGVSRRTFFHYFGSKEEILLAWKSGLGDAMRAAILKGSPDQPPLDAVLGALLQLAGQYRAEEQVRIERLLASSEHLHASKHAKYADQEQAVFEALSVLWPAPERRDALRLVAMMSVGALRIAIERWAERGGAEPLADELRKAFAALKAAVAPRA